MAAERLNRRMKDLENIRPPPITPQNESGDFIPSKRDTFLTEAGLDAPSPSPRPVTYSQAIGSPRSASKQSIRARPSSSPYRMSPQPPRTDNSRMMATHQGSTGGSRRHRALPSTPYSQSPGIFPPVSATARTQRPHKKHIDRATNTTDPSGQLYDDTVSPAIDWLDDYFDSQIENCLSSLPPLLEEEYALSKKWHINRVTQALTDPLSSVLWANHVELYDRAISMFRIARQQKDQLTEELREALAEAEEAVVDKKFMKNDHVMQISAMADMLQRKRVKKRNLKNKILELNSQMEEYRKNHNSYALSQTAAQNRAVQESMASMPDSDSSADPEAKMAKEAEAYAIARAAATEERMENILVGEGGAQGTPANTQAKAIENLQGMLLAAHKRAQQLTAELKGKTQMLQELQAHKEAGMGLERFIRNGEFDLVEMFNVILSTKEIWALRTHSLINNSSELASKFVEVIDTFRTEEEIAAEQEAIAKAKKSGREVKKANVINLDEKKEHTLSVKERRALLNMANAIKSAVTQRAAEPLHAVKDTQTVSVHKLMRDKETMTVADPGLDLDVERRLKATPEIAISSPLNFYKGKYKGSYIPIRLLTKTITRIYNEYLDVEHAAETHRPLPDFVVDYFYQQYGLKSLATANLEKFVASIVQYQTGSRKVKNFCSFCLISPPYYPHNDFEFFLDILHFVRSSKVGMAFPDSEDGTEWISWYRAMEATRAAIGHQMSPENFTEVCMSIDKMGVAVPIKKDRRKQQGSISPTESRVILILQKINDFLSHNATLNLKAMFNTFDTDGDGELDPDEFKRGLRSIQIDLEDEEFDMLIKRFDHNTNGKISYHEMQEKLNNLTFHTKLPLDSFQRIMLYAWHTEIERREEKMKDLFVHTDVNRDGVLTFDEFVSLVSLIDPGTPRHEMHVMYREAVSNDNDGMCVEDFIRVAHKYNLGSKRDKRIVRDKAALSSSGRAVALDSTPDLTQPVTVAKADKGASLKRNSTTSEPRTQSQFNFASGLVVDDLSESLPAYLVSQPGKKKGGVGDPFGQSLPAGRIAVDTPAGSDVPRLLDSRARGVDQSPSGQRRRRSISSEGRRSPGRRRSTSGSRR